MLADTDGDQWIFRRDPRVRQSLSVLPLRTPTGIPYLAPETQLLYKARDLRPKDEHDFATTLLLLGEVSRSWLAAALTLSRPRHPWIKRL